MCGRTERNGEIDYNGYLIDGVIASGLVLFNKNTIQIELDPTFVISGWETHEHFVMEELANYTYEMKAS